MITDSIKTTSITKYFKDLSFKPGKVEKIPFFKQYDSPHVNDSPAEESAIEAFFKSNARDVVYLGIHDDEDKAYEKFLEIPWRDGWGLREVGVRTNERNGLKYLVNMFNVQDGNGKVFNIYSYFFKTTEGKYIVGRNVWPD